MDELLSAFWSRDAHEITEKHPVLPISIMFSNDAESMGMGRERRLHLAVLIYRSEAIGDAELLGMGFAWKH
jgi:hypothetical protein